MFWSFENGCVALWLIRFLDDDSVSRCRRKCELIANDPEIGSCSCYVVENDQRDGSVVIPNFGSRLRDPNSGLQEMRISRCEKVDFWITGTAE